MKEVGSKALTSGHEWMTGKKSSAEYFSQAKKEATLSRSILERAVFHLTRIVSTAYCRRR